MYKLGLSIVNSQNHQILQMKQLLKNYGFPETDACVVPVSGEVVNKVQFRPLNQHLLDDSLVVSDEENYEKNFKQDYEMHHERSRNLNDDTYCTSETGQFTGRVNINAGELGKSDILEVLQTSFDALINMPLTMPRLLYV